MKGMTHAEAAEFRKNVFQYREDGHTLTETADHFGVRKGYVTMVCKGHRFPIDIEACKAAGSKATHNGNYNQWGSEEDRAQRVAKQIAERLPQFEYVGGYTGSDGYVDIRCKKCGSVQHRSMVSVRHGYATCDTCKEAEAKGKADAKKRDAEIRKAEQEKRRKEIATRKEAEAKEREERLAALEHPCVVCGTITTNKYCCSRECNNRRSNQIKEVRRRRKLEGAKVDRGITLQGLYNRDNGVCYICGGNCDWEDKTETETTIVCGDRYPSIDHVIPLARGGKHKWDNVRLAHRRCNSLKSDSILPLG